MKAILIGQFVGPVYKQGDKNNWIEFGILSRQTRSLENLRAFEFRGDSKISSETFRTVEDLADGDEVICVVTIIKGDRGLDVFIDSIASVDESFTAALFDNFKSAPASK